MIPWPRVGRRGATPSVGAVVSGAGVVLSPPPVGAAVSRVVVSPQWALQSTGQAWCYPLSGRRSLPGQAWCYSLSWRFSLQDRRGVTA